MKLQYLFNQDPWMLAEDIPEIDFQFSQIWLSSFVNDLEKTVGRNYKKIICVYQGLNLKFYYSQKDADDFAKHVLGLIIKRPEFGHKINHNIRLYSDKLKLKSRAIGAGWLRKLSNSDLARLYYELDELHTALYTWGWLPNAVDMFHGNFTNYLKEILNRKLVEDKVNQALVLLSINPEKSILQKEHESFLKLIILKQTKAPVAKFKIALDKHFNKYFYLKHLWLGKQGVYDKKYYLREIKKFIKFGESAEHLLRQEKKIFKQSLKDRALLLRRLKLSNRQEEIVDVYSKFAVTKLYRRDAQIYWAYKMDLIFNELAGRFKISFDQVRFLFPGEVMGSLRSGGLDIGLRSEIKAREKHFVYYATKNIDQVFYGREAEQIENKIASQQKKEKPGELFGQTACLGKARGRARIINKPADMKKMQAGDILISIATNPDIVPAMKKAAAIVTEQGGITSHAAIVSRELGIPCVIGTKIATKIFKDGDLLEVDANKGVVRIIKKK